MITDDEYLERIVAGIHAASGPWTNVSWNEKINGRQFDAVVRFTMGTLRYLVLVEVKNRTRPASAADIDAFVTKARDQNANKAVFVTAAGFQSGAIEVARRHGIDVFRVEFATDEIDLFTGETVVSLRNGRMSFDYDAPNASLELGEARLATQIESVTLVYTDGRRLSVPDEPSQMSYYLAKTRFKTGESLKDGIEAHIPMPALNETIGFDVPLARPQLIEPPDKHFFPKGKITKMECEARGAMAIPVTGNTLVEPTSFRAPVIYTDCLTGEVTRYSLDQLPLGLQHAQPGSFYFLLHPLRYYYCEKIGDGLVHWAMIESFQSGSLIRSRYTQEIQYSHFYMPVSSKSILRRLKARLADLRALPGNDA